MAASKFRVIGFRLWAVAAVRASCCVGPLLAGTIGVAGLAAQAVESGRPTEARVETSTPLRIERLRQEGRSAAALAELDGLPAAQAGLPELRALRARLLLDLDRLREAGDIYDELCERLQTAWCWNELGVVRMSLGGYNEAARAFERAVQIQGNAAVYSNLAVALAHARRPDEARANHDRALAIAPRNVQVRLNFGVFLFHGLVQRQDRRFDDAAQIFTELLAEDDPAVFYARFYLGRIYALQGKYQAALQEFNRGIELEAGFFDLYYQRALVRAKSGDPGGALSDLGRADRINPLNGVTDSLRAAIKRKR